MTITDVLQIISDGIGLVGVAIIAWGAATTTINTVRAEIASFRKRQLPYDRLKLRQQFGSSLLLGLEFLIAADVIRTVLRPNLEEIAILGGIVAIRTVISYFLHKEMAYDRRALRAAYRQERPSEGNE